MFFNEEIPWHQFKNLNNVRKLPLNEQVQYYNRYLNDLSTQRMWAQIGAAAGGDNTTSSLPTPLTLAFEISSESGTNVLISLATKTTKSVNVTYEWDAVGLVPAGSVSETIPPNTTTNPTIDLGAADTNVPFRIILSDASAIQNFSWSASDDDVAANQYQIWTAPTNLSALENTNLVIYEFQAVSSLDLSDVVSNQFRWVEDTTITSADLTNANIVTLIFTNCLALTTLTLTGLNYGNESGGYSFYFDGCALDQEVYEALLEAADASGYENGYINIDFALINPVDAIYPTIQSLEAKGWEIIYTAI